MIFSFRSSSIKPQEPLNTLNDLDHNRLIDISLIKLQKLQLSGKNRSEKQIIFVLEVLQNSLFTKSLKDEGNSNYL